MSIYGTWLSIDTDHEWECAKWVPDPEFDDGGFTLDDSRDCTCGLKRAPIVYEGSHILPSDDDRRGGWLDVAETPDFITRDGRDDGREGDLKDWLRLGIGGEASTYKREGSDEPYVAEGQATIILTRPLVEELRDTLTRWLEREPTEENG